MKNNLKFFIMLDLLIKQIHSIKKEFQFHEMSDMDAENRAKELIELVKKYEKEK